MSFLDLFLSWRWIVDENRIEVREGKGVDHERAVADFEAQGIRAVVVIAGGKAHVAETRAEYREKILAARKTRRAK